MKNLFCSLLLLSALATTARAGIPSTMLKQPMISQSTMSDGGDDETMNIIKLNLLSLPLKNISLQYERVLNRKFSAAMGFRYMPSSTLPFGSLLVDKFGGGSDTGQVASNLLDVFRITGYAITPEVRLYLSKKGYGRGFYLSAFYRYAHFNTTGLSYTVSNDNHVALSGSINTSTFGLMIGSQWKIGKFVDLDWWILGPNAGSIKGVLSGTTEKPMSSDDQRDLDNDLSNLDLPFVKEQHTVTSNSASLTLKGPWAGIRAGLALGVCF